MDCFVRSSVDEIYSFDLKSHKDKRGSVTFFENFPFDVKRIYFIHDVANGGERGGHAHKELSQVFIGIAGSFEISFDDGTRKRKFKMSDPRKAIFVPAGLWRELCSFSADCVCLVLGSAMYDESDYLRDYNYFINWKLGR